MTAPHHVLTITMAQWHSGTSFHLCQGLSSGHHRAVFTVMISVSKSRSDWLDHGKGVTFRRLQATDFSLVPGSIQQASLVCLPWRFACNGIRRSSKDTDERCRISWSAWCGVSHQLFLAQTGTVLLLFLQSILLQREACQSCMGLRSCSALKDTNMTIVTQAKSRRMDGTQEAQLLQGIEPTMLKSCWSHDHRMLGSVRRFGDCTYLSSEPGELHKCRPLWLVHNSYTCWHTVCALQKPHLRKACWMFLLDGKVKTPRDARKSVHWGGSLIVSWHGNCLPGAASLVIRDVDCPLAFLHISTSLGENSALRFIVASGLSLCHLAQVSSQLRCLWSTWGEWGDRWDGNVIRWKFLLI